MTDLQLAEYIVHIMCVNNFRNTSKWSLTPNKVSFTAVSQQYAFWTQITNAVQLLRTWINNPAAAQAYLTTKESSSLRLMIARHFLEHGI